MEYQIIKFSEGEIEDLHVYYDIIYDRHIPLKLICPYLGAFHRETEYGTCMQELEKFFKILNKIKINFKLFKMMINKIDK